MAVTPEQRKEAIEKELAKLPEAERKKVIFVQPSKKPKVEGVRKIDPATGKLGQSIFTVDFPKNKFIAIEDPKIIASRRRSEEKRETAQLAQKEAEFEAKRIEEGKIKAKDVILTQKGSKLILQKILKEKAEKEAEERIKFPTKEERIKGTLRKQRVLETLKKQQQKAREQAIKEQITKRKETIEIELPSEFLDPETARKVRAQLAGKDIQKTVIKGEFPDLRSFIDPDKDKQFSVIEARTFIPETGLITTEIGLIKFFARKKLKEKEDKPLEFLQASLEVATEAGISFEKEGKALAGASFIFFGKTVETAFGVSPPGIILSLKERGFAGTLEQFTGIPLISAVKEGKLLKATTPLGRTAEAGGIGVGVVIGSRITKASFKGAKKVIQVLQKESARLRTPEFQPEVRAEKLKGFEPVGKGQQKFVKLTESGQEIPQFAEDLGGVVRVVVSKKTGKIIRVIDPIAGKVFTGVSKGVETKLTEFGLLTTEGKIVQITGADKLISLRKPKPPKPIPKGKQIELGKTKEGFLDRELFDIEFEVPVTPTSKFLKFLKGKKAELVLETPALETKMISVFDKPPIDTRAPPSTGLILLPPIIEEEGKERVKFGFDIDTGRRLKREQEKELILSPALKELSAEDLGQILKPVTVTKPKIGMDIDLIRDPIRERERERELIIIPDITTEPDTRLDQELTLDIPKPPPPPPPKPPPKQIVLPPSLPRERLMELEEEEVFFVKAKSKGKFVKLNKKALPKNKALNLGAEAVDNTASATFKLIPAGKKKKEVSDDLGFHLRGKFTKKNSVYVEKNKHRIDSIGEIQGITVKGWLAQRRKGIRI